VVWNSARGRPFESSIEVSNYLADHLSLVLALLAPLYWIWPDVRLLLAVQAFVLALGAYPVYRLARADGVEERPALLFSLLYLVYPALGFINRFDFHAEALVVPLLLAALAMWRAQRFGWASLWLILALSCREETGLVVAGLGLVLAIRARGLERRLAWQWMVIGLVWSLLGMGVVMPHLRGQPSDTFLSCFQHLGPSYGAALARLVRDPLGVVRDSWSGLTPVKATFLPRLLLPLAFLPLLAPGCLVPLLPSLVPAVFSRCIPHSTIYYQYTAPMIPILFWGGIRGFCRLERFLVARLGGGRKLRFGPREGLLMLMVLGTLAALAWDPPGWKEIGGKGFYPVGRPRRLANREAFREVAALIPPDAPLAADNFLGPHFAHRRQFYFWGAGESWRADYILVNLATLSPGSGAGRQQLDSLERILAYPLYRHQGAPPAGVLLIDRGYPLEDRPQPLAPYGVRYWREGFLLLVRNDPPDKQLHLQILREVEQRRQAGQTPGSP